MLSNFFFFFFYYLPNYLASLFHIYVFEAVFESDASNETDQTTVHPMNNVDLSGCKIPTPVDVPVEKACNVSATNLLFVNYWGENTAFTETYFTKWNQLITYIPSIVYYAEDELRPYITGGPFSNVPYKFNSMHYYWSNTNEEMGSENKIDGRGFVMEIQMLHIKSEYRTYENASEHDDGICIVSFFGEISTEDNKDFDSFINKIQPTASNYSVIGSFNEFLSWLKPIARGSHFYTYPGAVNLHSFTKIATWILYKDTFSISQKQLDTIRNMMGNDSQPERCEIQPFNNRPLLFYVP